MPTRTRATPLIPHPGSDCCNPHIDLAAWVAAATRRLDIDERWARVYSRRGQRLRRAATQALTRGRHAEARELDAQALLYCGAANSIWTHNCIRRGDVERLVATHQHRLGSAA